MLESLPSRDAASTQAVLDDIAADAIPVGVWVVYRFAAQKSDKGTKHAMYRRMWKVRSAGHDAMVRKDNDQYVLVVMRY